MSAVAMSLAHPDRPPVRRHDGLRPYVRTLLDRLVTAGRRERGRWRAYHDAKQAISRACGVDASAGRYDPDQFTRAVAAYVREVGL